MAKQNQTKSTNQPQPFWKITRNGLAKLMAKLRLNAAKCLTPRAGLHESKILARNHLTGVTWPEVAAQGVGWVVKNTPCQWWHLTTTNG